MNSINYQSLELDDKYMLLLMIVINSGSKDNAIIVGEKLRQMFKSYGDIYHIDILSLIYQILRDLTNDDRMIDLLEMCDMDEDQDPIAFYHQYDRESFIRMITQVISLIKRDVHTCKMDDKDVIVLYNSTKEIVRDGVYKYIGMNHIHMKDLRDFITNDDGLQHIAIPAGDKYIDLISF